MRSSKAIEDKRNDICQKMQGYPGDGDIPNDISCRSLNKETNSSMATTGGSVVTNLLTNAGDTGDMGLILGLKRSPGIGNGNPL